MAPHALHVSSGIINAISGNHFTLFCIHSGYPRPNITWTINGTESKTHYNLNSVFVSAIPYDAGTYACHVSNGVGSDLTHTFEVNIARVIYWSYIQLPEDIIEGETAELANKANVNQNAKYEWFINVKPIIEANVDKRWNVKSNKIVISNVQPSDMSVIGCRVTIGEQSLYHEFDLRVISKAPVPYDENDNDEIIFVDDTQNIYCIWEAGPKPTVQWKKDGHVIEINGRFNYTDIYLEIENVKKEDAGEYECTATNKYGSSTFKKVVSVYKKPVFLSSIKDVEATIGSTVIFPCQYEIDEELTDVTLVWLNDGYKVDFDGDHLIQNDNSLKIMNVKESDFGTYYCALQKGKAVVAQSDKVELTFKNSND